MALIAKPVPVPSPSSLAYRAGYNDGQRAERALILAVLRKAGLQAAIKLLSPKQK